MRYAKLTYPLFSAFLSVSAILGMACPLTATAQPRRLAATRASVPVWSRGIKVPYRSWIPMDRPKAVLLCVHGLGFSSESYTEFGRIMAAHGLAVYAIDVRGFGKWMDLKGHDTVDFESCLTDVEGALKNIHKSYPGTPVILVGESMGGAIALAATSRYQDMVQGLISSVPSSDRYAKLSSELFVGSRYLVNKNKPIDMEPEVVNRATANPVLQKKWAAESNNRMKLTPKELKQFDDFMKGNYDAAALVEKVPVLMMAGFKDKLVKPEGTIELFNSINTQDKLLLVVGDGEHLLLEENQLTDQLKDMMLTWIKNETSGPNRGVTAHP